MYIDGGRREEGGGRREDVREGKGKWAGGEGSGKRRV